MSEEYISFYRPCIGQEEIDEVSACLRSGWLTTATRAKQFEDNFAKYVGAKHAVALNSCTAALHLALEAVGIGEGDLVLVPTLTFAATAEVVRYFKAIPVLVDCRADDFCMNMLAAEDILERIRSGDPVKGVPERHNGPKAIMPVHFAGQVADVITCRRLCDEYGLRMIEDCAHCCPAYYQDDSGTWRMVGQSADIACFSFYANKTITTGEGGMAVTANEELADRMRIMSLHGISKDAWKRFTKAGSWYYEIHNPGFKYNMPDTAAAIGLQQLKKADRFFQRRKEIVERYKARLDGMPGVILPGEYPDRKHSWHLYIIRVDSPNCGRDEFIQKLKDKGIGTSVHYMPLHLHPYYRENFGYEPEDLPVANKLFGQIVSMPIYPDLSNGEVDKVCAAVAAALKV